MTIRQMMGELIAKGWVPESGFVTEDDDLDARPADLGLRNLSLRVWVSVFDAMENGVEPAFDIMDGEADRMIWTRGVPTPGQALRLIREHGVPYGSDTMPEDLLVDAATGEVLRQV